MSTPLKILVGMALVLPMLAYVAGSLAASSDDDPGRRDPVILRDAPAPSTPPAPARRPATPQQGDDRGGDDQRDDDGRDDDGRDDKHDDVDDNEVRVVTPKPTRVGDDADDTDDDRQPERDDDDSRDGGADTDSDDDGGDD